jgi:hypothetical protein
MVSYGFAMVSYGQLWSFMVSYGYGAMVSYG